MELIMRCQESHGPAFISVTSNILFQALGTPQTEQL